MPTLTIPGFVDAHCHAFQRSLRPRERRRLLGLARRDDRPRGGDHVEEIRHEYAEVYRDLRANGYTAVGEFHYLGLDEARAAHEAAAEAGIAFVCLLRVLPAAAAFPASGRSSVAEYLRQLEALRGRRDRGRRRPPLRARLPGGGACASSAATPPSTSCRCTSTPMSSRARSRSAWPSTACGRSSCSRANGCLGPRTTVVHATHADGHELDLLADAGAGSASARRPRRTSATASCRSRASAIARSGFASAPTRTSASTRSRSCESSKGSRRRQTGTRGVSRRRRAACGSARTRALRRSGSRRGRTPSSISIICSYEASPSRTSTRLWSSAAASDVLRKTSDPVARPRRGRRSPRPGRAGPTRRRRSHSGTGRAGRRRGRLDLRALVPLVVRRDRDASACAAIAARHIASYVAPLPPRLHARVAAAAPRVVARPDRRRAEQVPRVRLGAQPREHAAAVRDDVVRVDAVEAGRRPQRRRAPSARTGRCRRRAARLRRRPVGSREVERPIDVERPDPVACAGRRCRRRRSRRVRPGTARGAPRRRCRSARAPRPRRQPQILGRAPAPPRHGDLVDARRADLVHLRADHEPVGRRVEAARRVVRRRDVVRRRVPVLRPVLVRAVARRCRTTGSRTPRRGRPRRRREREREQDKPRRSCRIRGVRRIISHPVGRQQWAARPIGRLDRGRDRDAAARLLPSVTCTASAQPERRRHLVADPHRQRLAERTLVAEARQVDLQRLRLEAERARPVRDRRGVEVGLVGDRADAVSSSLTSSTLSTPGFGKVSRPA